LFDLFVVFRKLEILRLGAVNGSEAMKSPLMLIGLAALLPALSVLAEPPSREYDLVVYGATAGGVTAAVAAAGEGVSVALIEPRHHVGGMTSGGLGATDFGRKQVIGGMARDFYEELGAHYGEPISWYFEPHQAERVLRRWLREARVELFFGSRLGTVEKGGARITALTLENGAVFKARVFIDCSYEGDLLARAGVSYTWGREGRDAYGESLAGRIEYSDKHQFSVPVNPRNESGNLLPLIFAGEGGEPGAADRKVQAYNFRLCMTQNPKNRLDWPRPEGYDPAEWALLRRYLAARPETKFAELCNPIAMPGGKTDTNNNGPISTDYIGASWGYPEGSYDEQAAIWADHERYVKAFFYFLAHDSDVPEALQIEVHSWGLAKDEFTDTGNWPHQLYVREARRMVGSYVTRQSDLQESRRKDDSIGMASYNSDSHHVQRLPATGSPDWPEGTPSVLNEGDMQVGVRPYDMPYRSFVPQIAECENLLVGCAFSASHVAYSSMRMEPQYMIIGQALGIAAVQALEGGIPVQGIDVAALQAKLRASGAILHEEEAIPDWVRASDLPGVVVDNDRAELIGDWKPSGSSGPFVGLDYVHDDNAASAENRVLYAPEALAAGRYEIRVSYSANPNRASRALIRIHTGTGVVETRVDQRAPQGELAPFVRLGLYDIAAEGGSVEVVGSPDAGGIVSADCVQWLPHGP
jgi:hypothetical protein